MATTIQDLVKAFDGELVVYSERYDRGGPDTRIHTRRYRGKDLLKVALKANNYHSYWVGDTIEEARQNADEEGVDFTPELLLGGMEKRNGDGCDYIFYVESGGVRLHWGDVDDGMEDTIVECD